MNVLLETLVTHGQLLDLFGVVGMGFLAVAGLRLAKACRVAHTRTLAWGAVALILGRVISVMLQSLIHPFEPLPFPLEIIELLHLTATVLMIGGLGLVVWGFWSHERGLAAKA